MGWVEHRESGGDAASYHEREAVWRACGIGLFLVGLVVRFVFWALFLASCLGTTMSDG